MIIMALSRTLVRLRNEVATIVSRPLGGRNVAPLYQLGTAETLRRLLTQKYGTAVADTKTLVTGWSLRHLAGSSAPPRGAALPAAPRRPPSPPPPHYGASAGSSSQALHGAETGPSAHPQLTRCRIIMRPKRTGARTPVLAMGPVREVRDLVALG